MLYFLKVMLIVFLCDELHCFFFVVVVELLIYFLGDSMDLVFGSRTKLLAFKLVPYFVV
jgi:hypothetical protein